jgi:phage-related baseplate assembly protein
MYTPPSKDIKYLGRDFDSIKQGLVDFVKTYYPNTYNDFNEASPGMMFLELVAYVGDTLNYYVDSQLKESLLLQATEKKNVLAIAAAMGYKPKISVPSNVTLDVYQLMPATGSGINAQPDTRYTLRINPGMRVQSTVNVSSPTITETVPVDFYVQDIVDFAIDTVDDPVEYSVYTLDANGNPEYYLAKKQVNAVSAAPVTTAIEVGAPTKFFKFKIPFDTTPPDFIGIDTIVDSDGNTWYEVPYLAQDTIFEQITNTSFNDPDAAVYSDEIPYLLKLKKVPRRFVTRLLDDGIEVQFGAGISTSEDEELLPTPDNIGVNLPTGKIDMDASMDPNAPGVTKAYGIAPSNTTLTVTYLRGGGVNSNVASNVITTITGVDTSIVNFPTNTTTLNTTILNSLAVNNPQAATGGRAEETLDEVRQNALKQLSSQNRAVTREDYIIRALAMPPQFGSVTKVFITPDEQSNLLTGDSGDMVANPLAMNMYILGYNEDKQITTVNRAVKENLKTYISHYRMLTDSINIRDAYVVNIQVNFDIIPLRDRNANEVLLTCINAMKDYFNIDRWQINQPITLSDIYNMLLAQPGVQTVTKVDISNLNDSSLGYSNIFYGIQQATRNGIIYPSLDPMIFEVKFPDNDIKGRIATY